MQHEQNIEEWVDIMYNNAEHVHSNPDLYTDQENALKNAFRHALTTIQEKAKEEERERIKNSVTNATYREKEDGTLNE